MSLNIDLVYNIFGIKVSNIPFLSAATLNKKAKITKAKLCLVLKPMVFLCVVRELQE